MGLENTWEGPILRRYRLQFFLFFLAIQLLFPRMTGAQQGFDLVLGIPGFSASSPEGMVQGEQLAGRLYSLLMGEPFLRPVNQQELNRILKEVQLTREEILQQPGQMYPVDLDLLIFGELKGKTLQYHLYAPRSNLWQAGTLPLESIPKGASELVQVIKDLLPRATIQKREKNTVTLSPENRFLFFPSQRLQVIGSYHQFMPHRQGDPFPNATIILGSVEIIQVEEGTIIGEILQEDYPIKAGYGAGLSPTATRLGDLRLSSRPTDSLVYIGDHLLGETPLTIQEIPAGDYSFILTTEDYQKEEKTVTVQGGTESHYQIILSPQPAMVKVTSNQTAAVYLNQKKVGETPWQGEVTPGYSSIHVEVPGYPRVSRTLLFQAARDYQLYLPVHGTDGSLYLTTDPPGATIWLNGEEIGETPQRIAALQPGYHELMLQRSLYQSIQERILIYSGEEKRLEITLEEAPGVLTLTTQPKGAEIFLEGRQVGTTPVVLDLPRGEHYLTVKKEGFAQEEITFLSLPEKEEEVLLTLIQLYGILEILSDPMGVHVYRDGELLGSTPLILEHHPAGRFTFTLKGEGMEERRTILIPGEEKKTVYIQLKKSPLLGGSLLAIYDPGMLQRGVELCLWAGRRHQLSIELTHLFPPADLGDYGLPYTEVWGSYRTLIWEGLGIYTAYQCILQPIEGSAFSSGLYFQLLKQRMTIRIGPYLREDITGVLWSIQGRLLGEEHRFSPLVKAGGYGRRKVFFSLGLTF